MPVYDQSYRRYEARAPLRSVRFWPITRAALHAIVQRRALLALVFASLVPFVVRLIQVFLVTRFPQVGQVIPVGPRLLGDFVGQQVGWVILLTIFAGSGLVARDLRTGAILVYLSRPLTRRDYVLGKLGVLLVVNLSVTLVPGLLLYLFSLALAPGIFLKGRLVWIAPAVALYSFIICLVVSLVALALSALSRSARAAGLAFFALMAVTELTRLIAWASYRQPGTALLSIQATLRSLGNGLFGIHERSLDVSVFAAVGVLLLVMGVCLAVLRRRVRAVEVVA